MEMHARKSLRAQAGWPGEETSPWSTVVDASALRRLARQSRTRMPQLFGLEDQNGARAPGLARAHPSVLWYLANQTPWQRAAMEVSAGAMYARLKTPPDRGGGPGNRFLAGDVYTFHAPIYEGDRITMVGRLGKVEEKTGRTGRLYISDDETLFWNQRNALVAKLICRVVMIGTEGQPVPPAEAPGARSKVTPAPPVPIPPPKQLTLADLRVGETLVLATPRTIAVRDVIMWASAVDDYIPFHWDEGLAKALGLPAPVVHGNLLACLLMTPLADWMGEAGQLIHFDHRIRAPVHRGDTVHVRATVAEKVTDQPEPCAQVLCELVDEYGVIRSAGTARVALPLK